MTENNLNELLKEVQKILPKAYIRKISLGSEEECIFLGRYDHNYITEDKIVDAAKILEIEHSCLL